MLEELMEGDCDYLPSQQASALRNSQQEGSTCTIRDKSSGIDEGWIEDAMLDFLYLEEALFDSQSSSLGVSHDKGAGRQGCKNEIRVEKHQPSQFNAHANISDPTQTLKSSGSSESIQFEQRHTSARSQQNILPAHQQEITPTLSASEYIKANQLQLPAKCDASLVFQLAQHKIEMLRKRLGSMVKTNAFDFTIAETYFDDASGDLKVKPQCSLKVRSTIRSTTAEYSNPRNAILWTRLNDRILRVETEAKAVASDIAFQEKLKYTFRNPTGCKSPNQTEAAPRIDELKHRLKAILQTQLGIIFQLDQIPKSQNHSLNASSSISSCFQHSIGHTLLDFAAIFHRVYGAFIVEESKKMPPGTQILWQLLPLAATDVKQVAKILNTLIMERYSHLQFKEETNNTETREIRQFAKECVNEIVMDAITYHLAPTIQSLYTCSYALEDAFFAKCCENLRSDPSKLFRALSISMKTSGDPLDHIKSLYDSYREAIILMEEMQLEISLSILLQRCTQICKLIQGTNQSTRSSLDMRKSLAFVIIASPKACQQIYSRLAMLGSLGKYSFYQSETSVDELFDIAGAMEHLTSHFISLQS
ncbi:unnamed protein product [Albugo candida]|nr:unnamed protein product [Albugo candida]|eukprot:CCI48776.1 unnamed protein product [Albugo candida]